MTKLLRNILISHLKNKRRKIKKMGITGVLITDRNKYNPQKTVETLINIFRNQGYIYKISKTEIGNDDYHYNIGVCKYYGSEDCAVMYVKSGKNTHAPLEREDSLTDSLWIEDIRYTDIILKILYEYFRVFQEDLFDCDMERLLNKKDIEKIYNGNEWRLWEAVDSVLKKTDITSLFCDVKIEYELKRNGKYQLILHDKRFFDFQKLKSQIISFFNKPKYVYYEKQTMSSCGEEFISIFICTDNETNKSFCLTLPKTNDCLEYNGFDFVKENFRMVMNINYLPGTEPLIKDFMQKYFEWYPDDYMYNTNEYDYSETGERIYTKDTISTFGE